MLQTSDSSGRTAQWDRWCCTGASNSGHSRVRVHRCRRYRVRSIPSCRRSCIDWQWRGKVYRYRYDRPPPIVAVATIDVNFQVSVLTEQVGAQTEKIKDLESLLENKRQKLDSTEEVMQDVSTGGRSPVRSCPIFPRGRWGHYSYGR